MSQSQLRTVSHSYWKPARKLLFSKTDFSEVFRGTFFDGRHLEGCSFDESSVKTGLKQTVEHALEISLKPFFPEELCETMKSSNANSFHPDVFLVKLTRNPGAIAVSFLWQIFNFRSRSRNVFIRKHSKKLLKLSSAINCNPGFPPIQKQVNHTLPSYSQYDSRLIILWTIKVYGSMLTILWTYLVQSMISLEP